MSKNLAGLASADLTLNNLSLVEITATSLTASSTTTTTDLSVSNNATITGNLALGALTDVEQAIEDAGEDFSAGTGLTLDTTQTPNVLNFTGGNIGTAHITTSGDIRGGTLKYLDPIPSDSNNHSDVKTKIDNLEFVGTTNFNNIATNTSNISTNTTNIATHTADIDDLRTTKQNTLTSSTNITVQDITCEEITCSDDISIETTSAGRGLFITDTSTTPSLKQVLIDFDGDPNNLANVSLNLKADRNAELKTEHSTDLTLLTNETKKHIQCSSSNFDTKLYFDNGEKLATTTNGIDITGGLTCDGLTTQNGAILGGDITTTSITQTGTTTNAFFGDTTFVRALKYADTPGDNSSTLINVKTAIDSLNSDKQANLTAGSRITLSNNTINVVAEPTFTSVSLFGSSYQIKTEPNQLALKSQGSAGIGFYCGESGTFTEKMRIHRNKIVSIRNDVVFYTGDNGQGIRSIVNTQNTNLNSPIVFQSRGKTVFGDDGNLVIESITGLQPSPNTETMRLQTYIDNDGRDDDPNIFTSIQNRYVLALQDRFGIVCIGQSQQSGGAKTQITTQDTNSPGGGGLSINGQTGKNGAIQVVCGTNGKDVDGISFKASNNDNHIVNFVNTSGGQRGKIDGVDSSTVNYDTGSDRRLKTNIQDMDSQLDNIMNLRPRKYNWIEDNKEGNGFIAQEIHEIYPQFREKYEDTYCADNDEFDEDCPCDASGNEYYYGLDYGKFTPYIIQAFQEFKDMYDNKIAELETRISLLENN